jgi:hypothetical protein
VFDDSRSITVVLLCNQVTVNPARERLVHRVSEHHQLQKTMIPYAAKLLNQEVQFSLGTWHNKTGNGYRWRQEARCRWIQTCSSE